MMSQVTEVTKFACSVCCYFRIIESYFKGSKLESWRAMCLCGGQISSLSTFLEGKLRATVSTCVLGLPG